jgi:hypothetical protein
MTDLIQLIESWRAALRAARSDDYKAFRADYERRAADYAMVIRSRLQ